VSLLRRKIRTVLSLSAAVALVFFLVLPVRGFAGDVLPDLSRAEVAIASNLIIDDRGKIRFFDLLDTTSFDAKLVKLHARLKQLLAGQQK
jgi:hypothetical protein